MADPLCVRACEGRGWAVCPSSPPATTRARGSHVSRVFSLASGVRYIQPSLSSSLVRSQSQGWAAVRVWAGPGGPTRGARVGPLASPGWEPGTLGNRRLRGVKYRCPETAATRYKLEKTPALGFSGDRGAPASPALFTHAGVDGGSSVCIVVSGADWGWLGLGVCLWRRG